MSDLLDGMLPARSRLVLNPSLDLAALAAIFARSGRIQISDFLTPLSAALLRDELMTSAQWRHVIHGGSKVFEIDRSCLEAMTVDARVQLDTAVHASAAKGFQYRYDSIRIPDRDDERTALGTGLAEFAQLMSHPATIQIIHAISGVDHATFADAQATSFRSGDFLTQHDDNVSGKHRKLAYVMSLTTGWRADWGGLLMFFDKEGEIIDTFSPKFNALSLFIVPQPHSVSYVAPFAQAPRLSVTGWFRTQLPII